MAKTERRPYNSVTMTTTAMLARLREYVEFMQESEADSTPGERFASALGLAFVFVANVPGREDITGPLGHELRRVFDAVRERNGDPGELLAAVLGRELDAAERGLVEAAVAADNPLSQATVALGLMAGAVGLPLDVARAPIFAPANGEHLQLDLFTTVGSLRMRPFRVLERSGPLTVRDALLLAHLTKKYAAAGCPADRWVHASLAESARCAGFSGGGGKQHEWVRDAHARLRGATYQHAVRDAAGNLHTATWGPVSSARTFEPGAKYEEGRASVKLSEEYAALVRGGALSYLDADTFRELVRRDELAARLWVFLESEALGKPWKFALFSAPEGEPLRERDTPAIADLLRISDWQRRRKVVERIRRAAAVILDVEPAYRLTIEHGKEPGMWTLAASRRGCTPRGAGVYSQGRGGVLPGARGCTPRGAEYHSIPANHGEIETLPSVLPSFKRKERAAPPVPLVDNSEIEEHFRAFWASYPSKVKKDKAFAEFAKLTDHDTRVGVLIPADEVAAAVRDGRLPERYVWNPDRFLSDGHWERWQVPDRPPSGYERKVAKVNAAACSHEKPTLSRKQRFLLEALRDGTFNASYPESIEQFSEWKRLVRDGLTEAEVLAMQD